jgi:putative transposase
MLQTGAQQLVHQAIQVELEELLDLYAGSLTKDGKALVLRNGYLPERQILTGIGPVNVRIPKVRSKTGEPISFQSALMSPYVRKAWSFQAALPWLYLGGISTGEMGDALKVLVGADAQGLSASTISRLKLEWGQQYQQWSDKPFGKGQWVYTCADGIYPETRLQRCWVHKTASILNALLKSLQPKAKLALHEIWQAEAKENAVSVFDLFIQTYEAKYPNSGLCLQKDREKLLVFCNFRAQLWQSIRISNPAESTLATIRYRTKRTKGCLSRDGILHMMFKLGQCAEGKWGKLRGFNYLAKFIKGIQFKDGVEVILDDRAAVGSGGIKLEKF